MSSVYDIICDPPPKIRGRVMYTRRARKRKAKSAIPPDQKAQAYRSGVGDALRRLPSYETLYPAHLAGVYTLGYSNGRTDWGRSR